MRYSIHTASAVLAMVAILFAPTWCCCIGLSSAAASSRGETGIAFFSSHSGCSACAATGFGDPAYPMDSPSQRGSVPGVPGVPANLPYSPCSDECQCSVLTLLARDVGSAAIITATWSVPMPTAAMVPIQWIGPAFSAQASIQHHGPPRTLSSRSLLSLHCQLTI